MAATSASASTPLLAKQPDDRPPEHGSTVLASIAASMFGADDSPTVVAPEFDTAPLFEDHVPDDASNPDPDPDLDLDLDLDLGRDNDNDSDHNPTFEPEPASEPKPEPEPEPEPELVSQRQIDAFERELELDPAGPLVHQHQIVVFEHELADMRDELHRMCELFERVVSAYDSRLESMEATIAATSFHRSHAAAAAAALPEPIDAPPVVVRTPPPSLTKTTDDNTEFAASFM